MKKYQFLMYIGFDAKFHNLNIGFKNIGYHFYPTKGLVDRALSINSHLNSVLEDAKRRKETSDKISGWYAL